MSRWGKMSKGQNGTDKSLSGQVRKFVLFK